MDDFKDKAKGLMKKMSNPFGSTRKFKGHGQILGTSSTDPSEGSRPARVSGPAVAAQQQEDWRRLQQEKWGKEKASKPPAKPVKANNSDRRPSTAPLPSSTTSGSVLAPVSDAFSAVVANNLGKNLDHPARQTERPAASLSQEDSSIFSKKQNEAWKISSPAETKPSGPETCKETQTSSEMHIDKADAYQQTEKQEILHGPVSNKSPVSSDFPVLNSSIPHQESAPSAQDLHTELAAFLSGGPSSATIEVILRLLKNIIKEPAAEKFRRIRMANPKIKETIGTALGGLDFMQYLGFTFQFEGDESWGVMAEPSTEHMELLNEAVALMESYVSASVNAVSVTGSAALHNDDRTPETIPENIDRQLRVFSPSSDSNPGQIQLPDTFYNLSMAELKLEAATRKKKLEDSELLIPKSFREKQLAAARRKYKFCVIRVQFPDGNILQGTFLPRENIRKLYEFVEAALKCAMEFELVLPASKTRILPFANSTLEEMELVPAAFLKFKSNGNDYQGLHSNYLSMLEPFSANAFLT